MKRSEFDKALLELVGWNTPGVKRVVIINDMDNDTLGVTILHDVYDMETKKNRESHRVLDLVFDDE